MGKEILYIFPMFSKIPPSPFELFCLVHFENRDLGVVLQPEKTLQRYEISMMTHEKHCAGLHIGGLAVMTHTLIADIILLSIIKVVCFVWMFFKFYIFCI